MDFNIVPLLVIIKPETGCLEKLFHVCYEILSILLIGKPPQNVLSHKYRSTCWLLYNLYKYIEYKKCQLYFRINKFMNLFWHRTVLYLMY